MPYAPMGIPRSGSEGKEEMQFAFDNEERLRRTKGTPQGAMRQAGAKCAKGASNYLENFKDTGLKW